MPDSPPKRRPCAFYGALGFVGLSLAAYLLLGPKPWEAGVAAASEAGKGLRTSHYVVSGEWIGTLVNLVLVAILLAAAPLLRRAVNPSFEATPAGIPKGSRLFFALAAAAAVLLAAGINYPRLSSSLWGDEEYTMKRTIVGDFERGEDGLGALRFREAPWIDTLWLYKNPNNHILNSILARTSHSLFFRPSDAPDARHFNETLIRLPAFLAGLGGIAALGWCMACLRFPRAGIIAMFLVALHPWFTRYGVDARGYAFVFLLFPLCLGFLVKGARSGLWRHFLAYAAFEFLLFLAYPGTLYLLIPMNLAGFLMIASGKGDRGARATVLGRFTVANIAAAMLVIQAMAPCLEPMREYLSRDRAQSTGALTGGWISDNLSYLVSGTPWRPWDEWNPLCRSLGELHPLAAWTLVVSFGGLFLAGIVRLAVCSRQTLCFAIVLVLPWPLFVFHSSLEGRLMYHWYTVITLPGTVIGVALGLEWLASRVARGLTPAGATLLVIVPWMLLFALSTKGQRAELRAHSVEPLRESVAATRTITNPHHPDVHDEITVGFCMATRGYDPVAFLFKEDDRKAFEKLITEARATGRSLHVNFALPGLARTFYPNLMEIIENAEIFDPLPLFHGLDSPCTRHVYRLRRENP